MSAYHDLIAWAWFSPSSIGIGASLTVIATLEAFIGLLIEVTFTATFTQRLFGK